MRGTVAKRDDDGGYVSVSAGGSERVFFWGGERMDPPLASGGCDLPPSPEYVRVQQGTVVEAALQQRAADGI
jgi:hypothetical protein